MSSRHLKWRPFNKFRAVSKFFDNGQNLYCFSVIFKQGQGIAKYILIPGLMFDNYTRDLVSVDLSLKALTIASAVNIFLNKSLHFGYKT